MVQKFKTLADAKALAEYAHRNQVDKAGEPYIEHPMRVLATVQAQGVQPYVQIAAVLHDVTEDTAFTPQMLLDLGFSEAAVRLVILLDRDESHKQYTIDYWNEDRNKEKGDNYYYNAIKNSGRDAVIIKLADIRDNMSPWRQAYLPPETQDRLRAKYAKALDILNPPDMTYAYDNTHIHDPYHLR